MTDRVQRLLLDIQGFAAVLETVTDDDRTRRLLVDIQGFAGQLESNHETAMFWLAQRLNGHPRAQDFEPTGHGGSDPTLLYGTSEDHAADDGKQYVSLIGRAWRNIHDAQTQAGKQYVLLIQRCWRNLDNAHAISMRNQPAKRKKPQTDEDIWCELHLQAGAREPIHRGRLCQPCYRRRKYLAERGLELTAEMVAYHARHQGKWPSLRVDPRIASVDRLRYGTQALTSEQAAEYLTGS